MSWRLFFCIKPKAVPPPSVVTRPFHSNPSGKADECNRDFSTLTLRTARECYLYEIFMLPFLLT
jgi:hypothetical protein